LLSIRRDWTQLALAAGEDCRRDRSAHAKQRYDRLTPVS